MRVSMRPGLYISELLRGEGHAGWGESWGILPVYQDRQSFCQQV
jgi:hypothetical protein